MADIDPASALYRLLYVYNGEGYDKDTNPGGLDDDGHTENFVPSLQDTATAAKYAAEMALAASQYAAAADGWVQELAAVAKVTATRFSVAGNKVSVYQTGRALMFVQDNVSYGYVAAASYSGTDGLTYVDVVNGSIEDTLTAVRLGLSIQNAPNSSSIAAVFFIIQNFVTP